MKLADFFVSIGVDADSLKVKDFAKSVGDIPLQVVGAVAALAGMEFEISKLAGEAMNVAVGFEAFHNQTGLSVQELQKWQMVATQANVSTEAMTSSVSGLQRQLAEIRLGRGNLQPFFMMGVNPRGDAFSVLNQIRKNIPRFDRATATNLISQMGLSPEMMNVLTLSQSKFEEFGRRVRGMSDQDEKAFLKSKLALQQLGLEFRDFSFTHLAPLATSFADLIGSLSQMKDILPAIGVAAAALGAAFAPVTTAIIGLLGLFDDILAYKQGRNSLIGTLIGAGNDMGKHPEKIDAKATAFGNSAADKVLGWLGIPKNQTIPEAILNKFRDGGGDTNIDIHVDGSHSPHETAEVVAEHLKRAHSRAGIRTSAKQDRR